MKALNLKVCGLRLESNIKEVGGICPEYMGFIFYPQSKRFVGAQFDPGHLLSTEQIKRVGVFVDESIAYVLKIQKRYQLDYLQLHGNENVRYCAEVKDRGAGVIKVFKVDEHFDFDVTLPFSPHVDFFLFDTKSHLPGGSGKKFDWELLSKYNGAVPFFLSGGISADDVEQIKSVYHPKLHAIDINSRFEISPGKKDVVAIKKVKTALEHDTF